MIPTLVETFGLPVRDPFPPNKRLDITFNDKGASYGPGGKITINIEETLTNSNNPVYQGGSLFHETTHAIFQGFGHDQDNWITESMVAILQVEALKNLPKQLNKKEAVKKYEMKWGYEPDLDCHLWNCYRKHGFDPFRHIIKYLGKNEDVLGNKTFIQDWNTICVQLKLDLAFPDDIIE